MFCYVLCSPTIGQYYVGITTETVESRLRRHNEAFYGKKFTSKVNDWIVYLEVPCKCQQQMLKIEKHIKNMNSKKYIENLTKYPEITIRLREKYSCN